MKKTIKQEVLKEMNLIGLAGFKEFEVTDKIISLTLQKVEKLIDETKKKIKCPDKKCYFNDGVEMFYEELEEELREEK